MYCAASSSSMRLSISASSTWFKKWIFSLPSGVRAALSLPVCVCSLCEMIRNYLTTPFVAFRTKRKIFSHKIQKLLFKGIKKRTFERYLITLQTSFRGLVFFLLTISVFFKNQVFSCCFPFIWYVFQ